jgi:hypothetical protein
MTTGDGAARDAASSLCLPDPHTMSARRCPHTTSTRRCPHALCAAGPA